MDRPRKSPQVLPLWMMEVTKIISPETRTTRYSIGQLAKKCGLSRTALLYYEKIGLLTPSARTTAGYRSYNQDDVERLAQILIFREMGIALTEIRKLLSVANIGITPILLNQINEINQQIGTLREQQNRIIKMFRKTSSLYRLLEVEDPSESKALLKQAGFDNHAAAFHWHRNFEHASPQEHARFLAVVGFSPTEIDALIRRLETTPAVPEQIS